MAANGIDTSFGSAASVAQDTAMIGAEDSAVAARNVMKEVEGFDIDGSNFRAEASAKRSAAKGAIIQAGFGAASTALGGASQYGRMKARAGSPSG